MISNESTKSSESDSTPPVWQSNQIALMTIVRREARRFLRIWPQTLVPPVITITLYFVVFGNLIGSQIAAIHGFTYIQFIVPGLIMLSVITNSYNNVVSSFFSSKMQRNIEELLISPVSTHTIIMGYLLGGVLRGLLVAAIITAISLFFTQLPVMHIWIILLVMLMTAITSALGGLVNAVFAQSFDDISIVPTFILTPLIYLGGVFYSMDLLSPFWQSISLINPMLYIVNAFRYGILGVSDVSIVMALAILSLSLSALYVLAWRLLHTGRGMRQ